MKTKKSTTESINKEYTLLTKPKNVFITEIENRIKFATDMLTKLKEQNADFPTAQREYLAWHDYNIELLKQSFDKPLNEYRNSYEHAGEWDAMMTRSTIGARPSNNEVFQKFAAKFKSKVDNLIKLAQKVELLKSTELDNQDSELDITIDNSKIFIVHGHDDLVKTETARFIERLGFEPIILHEQVSAGKTIIEKIEEYTNVGFAVVLYTPCDVGARKGDESNLKSRARQNVVFEHGYLISKIGRKNVCAIVKGNVETPNDISGVVYISREGDWKLDLAKEMRNSGYEVDMNLVI